MLLISEQTLDYAAATGNLPQSPTRPLIGRTSTDGGGQYLFERLPPGRYRVLVSKPGFASTAPIEGIGVEIRSAARSTLDIRMARGAAIDGTLVDSDGKPIVGAAAVIFAERVSSEGSERGASSVTNDIGQLRLASLLPGRYTVRVRLNGEGRTDWYYPGTARRELAQPVALIAGQTFGLGNFALPPDGDVARTMDVASRLGLNNVRGTSVIEGRVFDDFGDPAPWILVRLLDRRFVAGRFRLTARSNLGQTLDPGMLYTTDDLGRFRFARLLPGDYYLVALPEPFSQSGFAPAIDGLTRLLPMFFPNFDQPADAQPLRVREDDVVSGLTIALPGAKTGSVHIRLLDADGNTAGASQLTSVANLYRTQGGHVHPALTAQVRSQDGALILRDVPAGQYVLSPAGVNVFVAGDDLVNVSVPAQPRGLPSQGRIVFEDDGARPAPDQVKVASQLVGEAAAIGPGAMAAEIGQAWNVTWRPFGRPPSVVRLMAAPPGWALKRVSLSGQDVTDTPLDFSSGVDNLEILLTNRTGSVTGIVTNARQPTNQHGVILFAADRERWTYPSRFIHVRHVSAGGRFEMTGLLPGNYLIVPLPNNSDEGADPEWLELMRPSAFPIKVIEGQTARIAVPVVR